MPFHKITAIRQEDNGALTHYRASLDNGDTAHITRAFHACAPEIGDMVHEDGAVLGVSRYECLRPAMTMADNQTFNRLMAAIPEPGYWHCRVIASLATANNGRIMIRTTQENDVCRELFVAGVIGKYGHDPVWAFVTH
jgi:hypothetical protein